MTEKEKLEVLSVYIKSNVAPILVDFISSKDIPNSVIIPANCDYTTLNGYYKNEEFVSPLWYQQIVNNVRMNVLVIDKIDSITKEEQIKFIELLKYKKISSFKLPDNIVIILTMKDKSIKNINKDIYSLVAHI